MTDIKWIKITTDLFEDEKIKMIDSLPESDAVLVIWLKLLTLAGKKNEGGSIAFTENVPYSDEMLSTVFSRPLNTVRLALQTFQQFEMIEITSDDFIYISNWEKHQNIEGLDRIREQNRLRQQKRRSKTKQLQEGNATSRDSNALEEDKDKEKKDSLCDSSESPDQQNLFDEIILPGKKIPKCPQQEIVNLWSELMPEFPQPREWGEERQKALRSRWNSSAERQDLDWWVRFFNYMRKSPFLMGQVDQPGRKTFIAKLDWTVKKANFLKIIEGDYHE